MIVKHISVPPLAFPNPRCPLCGGRLAPFDLEPPDPNPRGLRCPRDRAEWPPDGINGFREEDSNE